ncbi:MAG TPA: beta-galactosidase GalB [Bryobacteraceae bacterium]|nr:beta-galactosidase GalB [Bryobacteraceae bacterium]
MAENSRPARHGWHVPVLALFVILSAAGADRRVSFDNHWKFFKGQAAGAEQLAYEDATWRKLNLPHDWAIEGPFDRHYNGSTGRLPIFGVGWYRKIFAVPAGGLDLYYSLEFDGAMANSTVWVSGHEAGGRPYGYSSFEVDLTPYLQFGGDNLVAVRLAPEPASSRWYPGAGIYRNVWLVVTGPVHVAHWGTYVTTPVVSEASATIAVRTEVRNRKPEAAPVTIETAILDAEGTRVARHAADATIAARGSGTVSAEMQVDKPRRWSVEEPYLYQAVTTLRNGDTVLDRVVTPFGIRTLEFSPDKGLLLNGRVVKLKGVCDHHDLGALGAAVNRRAIERQLEILRAMGANAIRTSHNPPAPELLEACDRMGLLVIEESYDMWHIPKVPNGYAKYFDQWGERDLRDMIRRDRNHPSVILWSIGNEVPEQGKRDGWKTAKRLAAIAHEEDPSRKTTAAFDDWKEAIANGLADQVDVPGFNYKAMYYEQILREHPRWVIYGSETAGCASSRGFYQFPAEAHDRDASFQVTSYDVIAPPWAYCPDVEFEYQERVPNVLGGFVWSGFDYLGEPWPYDHAKDWPARSSYFGIVDLAGFPKDRYYLYQSQWATAPMLHILPHWNWAGMEGRPIPVMAYTNAEEVELWLNGKSLGRRRRGVDTVEIPVGLNVSKTRKFTSKYRLEWDVPYKSGTLRAVAYTANQQVAVEELRTAGAPAKVRLIPDRAVIKADGNDLSFITVRIEDQSGNLCPLAGNQVRFQVTGAGEIAAVDNGDAASAEPFQSDHRKVFNGLALVMVRSRAGQTGSIQVTASVDGLQAGAAVLNAR